MKDSPEVSIVIPLYNESAVFPKLIERLDKLLLALDFSVEVVLIDDGSKDSTAALMQKQALENDRYTSVFLSRNYGHQLAVSAGMQCARGTVAVMIIDGDLQDPPELITAFYDKLKSGYDVVFGVRKKRKEGLTKRVSYWMFYRLLNSISEINIPLDSGDFCMMSRRVNDILVAMPEQSRFIRGMRNWVGFNQFGFEYERDKRASGEPKYSFTALFRLAYDGIFNFSYLPLKVITRLGFFSVFTSFGYLGYVLYKKLMGYDLPSGFTALIFAIVLFSGVQLICLGIMGEYLSRIFMQIKNRPLFVIKNRIVDGKVTNG
jgi:polyisoprenyl-phosphate glycosyltransferase